jgi:hypothetical protein
VKFLRLSDKRADDSFRAGRTWGHEITVPAKNVLRDNHLKYGEDSYAKFNVFTGLNADARKFLQANGVFKWRIIRSMKEDTVVFRMSREDAAMFFKLKFA